MTWVLGFAAFLGVGAVIFLALEAVAPGSGTNPFVGVVIGAVAGWVVTKVLGDD
jgi:hypothetical protein